ncbi:hypothetical protein B0H13DRAFT_2680925 [Mycena leptocephala]|nr:hypothetical protein B0H13DRAFT_2680925 [Mycena leptocephala]
MPTHTQGTMRIVDHTSRVDVGIPRRPHPLCHLLAPTRVRRRRLPPPSCLAATALAHDAALLALRPPLCLPRARRRRRPPLSIALAPWCPSRPLCTHLHTMTTTFHVHAAAPSAAAHRPSSATSAAHLAHPCARPAPHVSSSYSPHPRCPAHSPHRASRPAAHDYRRPRLRYSHSYATLAIRMTTPLPADLHHCYASPHAYPSPTPLSIANAPASSPQAPAAPTSLCPHLRAPLSTVATALHALVAPPAASARTTCASDVRPHLAPTPGDSLEEWVSMEGRERGNAPLPILSTHATTRAYRYRTDAPRPSRPPSSRATTYIPFQFRSVPLPSLPLFTFTPDPISPYAFKYQVLQKGSDVDAASLFHVFNVRLSSYGTRGPFKTLLELIIYLTSYHAPKPLLLDGFELHAASKRGIPLLCQYAPRYIRLDLNPFSHYED